MDKVFKLKQNGTTVKTEILAGLTTFMTMAYIIALNPNLLTNFGADGGPALWKGVFMATCIASAIGMFFMAFLANKPFALAPGMGLNSFFAIVVANIVGMTGMSYLESFQSALCIIFIEGIVFILLSLFNIREKIVEALPYGVRMGIGPAIGLMLMNIGFGSNAGVYSETGGPFYAMRDFFGALTPRVAQEQMGSGYGTMILTVVTMFVGVLAILALDHKKIKGAVLIGMLIACAVNWGGQAIFFHTNPFAGLQDASFVPAFREMAETTLFKLNFSGLTQIGFFTMITLVITFCIIDMFDTIGTLVGTASRANMLDKEGKMPQMKEALLSDAVGTVAGSLTGLLFLACMFIAPIAAIIPAPATSAALIYVGILMLSNVKNIDFHKIDQVVPLALMLLAMTVSGSIGHGIGIAMITYTLMKVFTGKAKEVSILTYVISAIFLLKFFLVV